MAKILVRRDLVPILIMIASPLVNGHAANAFVAEGGRKLAGRCCSAISGDGLGVTDETPPRYRLARSLTCCGER
jgi:hypothetical protein